MWKFINYSRQYNILVTNYIVVHIKPDYEIDKTRLSLFSNENIPKNNHKAMIM